jgi:CRP-like cAMP-binding protein
MSDVAGTGSNCESKRSLNRGKRRTMELRDEFAKRFPSLAGALSPEELDVLLGALERRELLDGDLLLSDGEPSRVAYLLLEGTIRIVLNPGGAYVDAGVLEAGTWIGEVSLLDGEGATATAIATEPARTLALRRSALDRLRSEHPRVASVLLRTLCRTISGRVRRATDQLESLRLAMEAQAGTPREQVLESLRTLAGARRLK